MAESTTDWFGVREKYYLLADKPWLISQIRSSEQTASIPTLAYDFFKVVGLSA